MTHRRLQSESGYSLVEVLVAIVILAIAIIPMVGMFDAGLRAASTSGNYDKARSLANANLETIKAKTFSDAGNVSTCPVSRPSFTCSVNKAYVYLQNTGSDTVVFKDSGTGDPKDMLKVNVTVEWGSGNSYSTVGVVSK
ncbi:MAG: prepilin-type N-terminal cleavage/methylation domain-containing protein [Rubrobacteraceae bacterium]